MAKAENTSTSARSPRGTKPVIQAFFAALEQVPDAARAAVAKAAQAMIRDELRLRRDKMKAAAAKLREKARKPAPAKAAAKPAPAKPAKPSAPTKRRGRKSSDIPVAA